MARLDFHAKEKVLCERREARKDKQTTEDKKLMLEARN